MKKSKIYRYVRFTPEVVQEASEILDSFLDDEQRRSLSYDRDVGLTETESWSHDTDAEFFADFRKDHYSSRYSKRGYAFNLTLTVVLSVTEVSVKAPDRHQIETIFEVFEKNAKRCKLPLPPKTTKPKPRIFIGHGRSEQWKELKDHLHEKHGYDVEAYEIGARAGHAIRDILEEMLDNSSFAILVMTGEDRDADGKMRARQNVIHELGLFQGRLGFSRAIALLEKDTEDFSNIHGIQQIRYNQVNVKETFGDVLATLRREFRDE